DSGGCAGESVVAIDHDHGAVVVRRWDGRPRQNFRAVDDHTADVTRIQTDGKAGQYAGRIVEWSYRYHYIPRIHVGVYGRAGIESRLSVVHDPVRRRGKGCGAGRNPHAQLDAVACTADCVRRSVHESYARRVLAI